MELLEAKNLNNDYELTFKSPFDSHTTVTVTFQEEWRTEKSEHLWGVYGSYHKDPPTNYPLDVKTSLRSFPIHIPHPFARYVFKTCLDYFFKETSTPAQTSLNDHPGYPLVVVTYNSTMLFDDEIDRITDTILSATFTAKFITEETKEEEHLEDEDLLDQIDEAVVVDFEFEEELQQTIKKTHEVEYLSLEGEDD